MSEIFDVNDRLEQEKRQRRTRRIAEMKRKKRQQELRRKLFARLSPVVLALLAVIFILCRIFPVHHASDTKNTKNKQRELSAKEQSLETLITQTSSLPFSSLKAALRSIEEAALEKEALENAMPVVDHTVYSASATASTEGFDGEEVFSSYGIVIDLNTDTILAQKEARTRINPASMTKVLTLLVAAEHVSDLDDTFTITQEINNYVYSHDCSAVNFDNDETVTIRDLFYGTALPSGADASLGLAYYVAGSQEAFVALMNEKLEEMGLSASTHFTNCIGLYDENHYSTMYDIAMIMEAAINNEVCREVLSAHIYTTSPTPQHPEGIEISNWFLRRIEDKDTHGEVICAKTGFVVQSRNCAVSYGTDKSGNGYIIATGDAHSSWRCIYDHVALYQKYL